MTRKDVALSPSERQVLARMFGPQQALQFADTEVTSRQLAFRSLVRAVREHRWLISAAAAIGPVLAIMATLMTTPLYQADVTLEVHPPSVEILDEDQRETETTRPLDFVAAQARLLSSQSLAEQVVQDLNLHANPSFVGADGDAAFTLKSATARLQEGLRVDVPERGHLIKFSFISESPQLAARIANGIAENFIHSSVQRRYDDSAAAGKFLQQQIAKTRAELAQSERALVSYAQSEGIIGTHTSEGGQSISDVSSLQKASLVALNEALAAATARRVQAEESYRQAGLAGAADIAQSTQALRESRAALEAEYRDKRTLMKPDHPDMLRLRSRIDEIDRLIGRESTQAAAGRSSTLLAKFRAAQSAEDALRSRISALKGSVLDLRRYNILEREIDTNRGLYDALLQRYKEIRVAGIVEASPISLVDRAEVPSHPFRPNLLFNVIVGLALGAFAGIAAALARYLLHDTTKTRNEVSTKLKATPQSKRHDVLGC